MGCDSRYCHELFSTEGLPGSVPRERHTGGNERLSCGLWDGASPCVVQDSTEDPWEYARPLQDGFRRKKRCRPVQELPVASSAYSLLRKDVRFYPGQGGPTPDLISRENRSRVCLLGGGMRAIVDFDKFTKGDLLPFARGVAVLLLHQHHIPPLDLPMKSPPAASPSRGLPPERGCWILAGLPISRPHGRLESLAGRGCARPGPGRCRRGFGRSRGCRRPIPRFRAGVPAAGQAAFPDAGATGAACRLAMPGRCAAYSSPASSSTTASALASVMKSGRSRRVVSAKSSP